MVLDIKFLLFYLLTVVGWILASKSQRLLTKQKILLFRVPCRGFETPRLQAVDYSRVSEGAVSGDGEECGTDVCAVRPNQFLLGQAGIGCHMRVDPIAGWDWTGTSLESDTKSRGRD